MLNQLRRLRLKYFPRPEDIGIGKDHPLRFAESSTGIVHIGAHTGEEAWIYATFRRPVIWVEANPHLFPRLQKEISKYPKQIALQCLLTDREGESSDFLITNNDGASGSILQLAKHAQVYPEVEVTETIRLISRTLKSVLEENANYSKYNALVIDVQGAELTVLRGAGNRLKQFKWIYAECSDFELYKDCCTLYSLSTWLQEQGFYETRRNLMKDTDGIGSIYDVLFERR
jgi:FkbM family methyltransferase